MTIKEFVEKNIGNLVLKDRFLANENTLNASIKASTAIERFNTFARKLVDELGKEDFKVFCKEHNYSSDIIGISDPKVNYNIPLKNEEYTRHVGESLIFYFTELTAAIKKKKPSFNLESTLDEMMKVKDQYEEEPELVEHKVIDNHLDEISLKAENVYGKDSKEYKEFIELYNFANENIKHSDLPEPSEDQIQDNISLFNKGKFTKEAIKDKPAIKDNTEFIMNSSVNVQFEGTIKASNNFRDNMQVIDELKKAKLELSPEYKDFLRKYIPKFIENNIACKGEEAFKNYGFGNYIARRTNVTGSINDVLKPTSTEKDIKNLHQDLKNFKSTVDTLDELFSATKEGLKDSYLSAGNIDVIRNKTIPVKYRFDTVTASHFNGLAYIAGFIRDNNINLDEFLEDPYKFEKFTYKSERNYKNYINDKFKNSPSKADILADWIQGDMIFFANHMTNIYDYRPFEALTMNEINKEYREKGLVNHSLRMDLLGTELASYTTEIVCGDIFKPKYNEEKDNVIFDKTSEVMANFFLLEKKDLTANNLFSGVYLDFDSLKMEDPINRREYLNELGPKNLKTAKEQLLDTILQVMEKNENVQDDVLNSTMLNTHMFIYGAQKAAAEILKANTLDTKSKDFKDLMNFVKNPYNEFNKYLDAKDHDPIEKNRKYTKAMDDFVKSNIVKELDLEQDIDVYFGKVFSKPFDAKNYSKTYAKFIGAQLGKLPKKERTEEKLADIMQMTDKVMEENVFPKHGLEFTNELKLGGMEKQQIKKLSRKTVPAAAAVDEAGKNIGKNLEDDKLPKDEKVMKSVASLNNLEDQHRERSFSIFHIPSYYREWRAIKDLKQQIMDAGVSRATLENAQMALRENPELMAAFEGSPLATKLFTDAKDEYIAQYRQEKENVQKAYNLEELSEKLHNDLNVSINGLNKEVPVSQRVSEVQKIKVKEFDQPTNQELNAPH